MDQDAREFLAALWCCAQEQVYTDKGKEETTEEATS